MPTFLKTLISLCLYLTITSSFGQYIVEAGTKYQILDDLYSDYSFQQIELRTGLELNQLTNSDSYDFNADYALLIGAMDEKIIVKLTQKIQSEAYRPFGKPITKQIFEFYCQTNTYAAQGTGPDGSKWKFCFYSGANKGMCY